MKPFARIGSAAIATVAAWSISAGAFADVPGRVGRIAYLQGDVQSYSGADPQWKAAYLNQPVTSHNSVFVGDAGRAEISVGSTTLAMDPDSQLDIQRLDDNTFNANVVRGRVSIRVRRFDPGDAYRLAVPGGDFALLKPGRYRIDALENGSGVTVFSGQASARTANGNLLVDAGTALRATRDPSNPDAQPSFQSTASVPVPLDDWLVARESRFRGGVATRYVSPRMTGYEDLDANGLWTTEPDYGPVWYPTTYIRADWVPYRYGRWAYVAPWGYTWIDDAPWGFAPFHYGRWVQIGSRWGWCPGAYVARPVYAPALVGFYGGSGVSISFSVGNVPAVGWYPLAPWQRYQPHYTQNVTYIRQVNNITIVNPPRRLAREDNGNEWNRIHGGTVAPQEAFASQRSISRVAMAAPSRFASHAAPLSVTALPRPAAVPAALRPGPRPEGGIAHPEFRSPREFAMRPLEGDRARAAIQAPQPPSQPPARERNPLPPDARRMQEAERANSAYPQPFQGPAVPGQPDRPAQVQHNPNVPNFNANARPMREAVPPPAVHGPGGTPLPPRVPPWNRERGAEGDARFAPPQPRIRPPQPVIQPMEAAGPHVGRPERELRNLQPRPLPIERPQQVAPPAPVVPIAAVPQPRIHPQRIEAPRPARVEPAPLAPRDDPRPFPRVQGREGPNRVDQQR